MIRFISRILLLLFLLGLVVIVAKAQFVVPNCVDVQKRNEVLVFQLEQTKKQLADSTAQIDRAWKIIAAYRVETTKLRNEYDKALTAAQTVPLQALRLVEDYQGKGCFLGLCYRKRLRKIREALVKTREP